MGKKGGSSGTPHITVPQGVAGNSILDQQLGAYSAGMLPSLLSESNWAANLATGGNLSGSLPNPFNTVGGGNSVLGNQTLGYTTGLGTSLSMQPQQFGSNPFGLGGSGGTGAVGGGSSAGVAGSTGTAASQPAAPTVQTYPTSTGGISGSQSGYAGTPVTWQGQQMTPIYDQNTQQFIGWVGANGQFQGAA